jgi:hypothetical protein
MNGGHETMNSDYGTFEGRPLDGDHLAELVAEAEHGYDVDEILRRRGGRPALGDGPSVVVPVRLSPAQREALDRSAARTGRTRSEVVRDALDAYTAA